MKMKRHSFRRKILCALCLLSFLIIVTICITVGVYYTKTEMRRYTASAYAYAQTAAEYIDGNRIAGYIESLEEDEYYQQILDFLNSAQKNSELLYYYVFVPYEEDLVYIWDADMEEGARPLGYHEDYMEGGKEASMRAMAGKKEDKMLASDDETYGRISSVYYPIYNSAGESVALVGVDISTSDIKEVLLKFTLVIIVGIAVVILIFISILYVFFSRSFILPINRLNDAARNMAGNLESGTDMNISIATGDEIEELASSFNRMYIEVREYIRKLSSVTAEKERIGAELSIATHIQSSMLPCVFPAFPEHPEIDIYAVMKPAKEVGGDFYDFFMVDDTHLAIVMADVSGKGVPAALFMVIGKTLIKDHTQPDKRLDEVFAEVNRLLCESNSECMFITAFEGVLDTATGEFRYVNAGHETPFIYKNGRTYEPYEVHSGFVLAGIEGNHYQEGCIRLEPGDRIFQYTDGVPEAMNADNELYGMTRLEKVLKENADKTPQALLAAINADIASFAGDAPQFDDITMLCMEYRQKPVHTPMTSAGHSL